MAESLAVHEFVKDSAGPPGVLVDNSPFAAPIHQNSNCGFELTTRRNFMKLLLNVFNI